MDLLEQDYTDHIKKIAQKVRGKDVLDVGCGSGFYTNLFCKNKNNVRATDIKDRTLPQYRKLFEFKLSETDRLAYSDETFDLVVSFDVIEHVEDDANFIAEIKRVLKPGGRLVVATPNKLRIVNIVKLLLLQKPFNYPLLLGCDPVLGECIHLREYSPVQLKNLFKKVGFCNLRVEKFWFGVRIGKLEQLRLKKVPSPFDYLSQYLFVYTEKIGG